MTFLLRSGRAIREIEADSGGPEGKKLRDHKVIDGSLDGGHLIKTFGDAAPTGVNIRLDGDNLDLYYRLKDARSAARNEERNLNPGEPIRLSSSWSDVSVLAREALETVTKDLEILAWLAEAELRLGGFAGLRDVFRATAALVDGHWDALHSIDGDGVEDKVAPFAGLNGVGAEGTLIQPLRLTPLLPDTPFFEFSLWDFQTSQRPGEEKRRQAMRDAVAAAGSSAMQAYLGTATECLDAFGALSAAFGERCGALAPPASNVRGVLEEIRLAIFNLTGLSDASARPRLVEKAVAPVDPEADPEERRDDPPRQPFSDEITSREQAFDLLLKVASYFRTTEPHSPISMSIETMVTRGRMDFVELLNELMPNDDQRRQILISAGIQPQSSNPK